MRGCQGDRAFWPQGVSRLRHGDGTRPGTRGCLSRARLSPRHSGPEIALQEADAESFGCLYREAEGLRLRPARAGQTGSLASRRFASTSSTRRGDDGSPGGGRRLSPGNLRRGRHGGGDPEPGAAVGSRGLAMGRLGAGVSAASEPTAQVRQGRPGGHSAPSSGKSSRVLASVPPGVPGAAGQNPAHVARRPLRGGGRRAVRGPRRSAGVSRSGRAGDGRGVPAGFAGPRRRRGVRL